MLYELLTNSPPGKNQGTTPVAPNNLVVSPIPAGAQINLQFQLLQNSKAVSEITNAYGQQVKTVIIGFSAKRAVRQVNSLSL